MCLCACVLCLLSSVCVFAVLLYYALYALCVCALRVSVCVCVCTCLLCLCIMKRIVCSVCVSVCVCVCVCVCCVCVLCSVCVLCGGSRWSQATGENSCQAAPGTAAQMGMNMRVATRVRMVTRMDEERRKIIA